MRTSLTLAVLVAAGPMIVSSQRPAPSDPFVIRDVRVFDGERTIDQANVVVKDGRIQSVGEGSAGLADTSSVDGRGRTLLPGLIDSHVHVAGDVEGALEQSIVMGVTTVLDMFNAGERLQKLKQAAARDSAALADVRTAATGASAPGGHPSQMGGPPFPTLTAAAEAETFVDSRIAEGADYIKIIYDDVKGWGKPLPKLDRATLDALIVAAHRRGKLAVVHATSEADAREAVEAGADVLVHLFGGATASPGFGKLVAEHRAAVTPTLSVVCGPLEAPALLTDTGLSPFIRPAWRRMLEMPRQPPSCAGAEAAIKQLVDARVTILAGTDAPSPGTAYGVSLHGELSLLVRSGLSPTQALAAATSAPARTFRLNDRGSIRARLRADLLLVDGDPTRDILATRRIVGVWKRGVPVKRESRPN